jgi:predicted DNA-binding transcriptional regulator YafY
VLKSGVWYLVAQAMDAEPQSHGESEQSGLRVYRVSRILELTTLQESFERPADFDLATYWRVWSAEFERRLYRGEAAIRLSPRIFAGLGKYFNAVMAQSAEKSAGPPDVDGWRVVTIPIESLDFTISDLLRLGSDVEVLSPPELRTRFAGVVASLAARYLADGAPGAARGRDAGTRSQREEREQRRNGEIVGQ